MVGIGGRFQRDFSLASVDVVILFGMKDYTSNIVATPRYITQNHNTFVEVGFFFKNEKKNILPFYGSVQEKGGGESRRVEGCRVEKGGGGCNSVD